MPGLADLIDSDMEDSHSVINENSILSSASDGSPGSITNEGNVKKPRKRRCVTMKKPTKSKIQKTTSGAKGRNLSKAQAASRRKALDNEAQENAPYAVPTVKRPGRPKTEPRSNVRLQEQSEMEMVETEQPPSEEQTDPVKTQSARSRQAAGKSVSRTIRPTHIETIEAESLMVHGRSAHEAFDNSINDLETPREYRRQATAEASSRAGSRIRQATHFRRRAGSASDTERGDPNLRRKLGDVTRKFENIDVKYRNLKEVGVHEANSNLEKMKRQCDATVAASNELIASLRKELAAQTPLANEARKLKAQLQQHNSETEQLRSKIAEMSSTLTTAQNEIKSLQAKVAAARNTISAETTTTRTPGSALRNSAAPRPVMLSGSEFQQAAQMKEDLYSDLTGLIIRSVKRAEDGDTYDCIQTGRNGTLHFKLFVDQEEARGSSFEETEFLYTPLLDANRDRDMIELMPTYLTEDITFARQNAAKFYGRVVDTLTKRRADE